MIRVMLKGALGNQLFQYAHGKALAIKHNVPLVLDLSFLKARVPFKKFSPFRHATYRDYYLDIFNIEDETTTFFNQNFLDTYLAYPLTLAINKVSNSNFISEGENPYEYDETISEKGPELFIDGFWNNPKYFSQYQNELKNILDLDKLYDEKFSDFEKLLKSKENAVSVHVRRGDYLNSKNKNIYIELDDYYIKAIDIIKKKVKNPFFFIFSESDSDWIENKLNLDKNSYEVVGMDLAGHKDSGHFRFMGFCKHNITANSSYSWWAAYLNPNEDKTVVAPEKWHYKFDFENLSDWITVEN